MKHLAGALERGVWGLLGMGLFAAFLGLEPLWLALLLCVPAPLELLIAAHRSIEPVPPPRCETVHLAILESLREGYGKTSRELRLEAERLTGGVKISAAKLHSVLGTLSRDGSIEPCGEYVDDCGRGLVYHRPPRVRVKP